MSGAAETTAETVMRQEVPQCLHSLVKVIYEAEAIDLASVSSQSPAQLLEKTVRQLLAFQTRARARARSLAHFCGPRARKPRARVTRGCASVVLTRCVAVQKDALRNFSGIDDAVALMRLREVRSRRAAPFSVCQQRAWRC